MNINTTIIKIDFLVGVSDSGSDDLSTAERIVLCKEDGGYTIKYSLKYFIVDMKPELLEQVTRALLKLLVEKFRGVIMLRFSVNGSWFYPPRYSNFLSDGLDVKFRDVLERFNIMRREFYNIDVDKDNFDRLTNSVCQNENYVFDANRLITVPESNNKIDDGYLYQEKVDIDKDDHENGYDIDIPISRSSKPRRPFGNLYSDDDIDYDDDEEDNEDDTEDSLYGDYDELYRDIFSDSPDYDDEDDYDEDDEDEDEEEKPKRRKKKDKKKEKYQIRSSRVLEGCKHPKKNYDKYGILIADCKDDIRDDIETILEFLEEFIPNDSAWADQFRRELSYKWALQFTSTKKQLKKKNRGKKMEKTRKLAKTYADSVDLLARCVSNKTIYVLK